MQLTRLAAIIRRLVRSPALAGAALLSLTLLSFAGATGTPSLALDYANPARWICRPGASDVCAGDLSATVVETDGTLTVQPLWPNSEAPVDCFYVYPTVSRDSSVNSDASWGIEELWATFIQAAPLGGVCRVYAPGYRQITVSGVGAGLALSELAYADVLSAWRHYLDHDNHGRGVILLGHSQGAAMLRRLIAEQIDDDREVRGHLVAAYLAGVSLQVPVGADAGGDFRNIPVCRASDQVECVVAWSTYRSTAPPPPDGLFGRAATGMEAVCVNPAALAGGSGGLLPEFPVNRGATILSPTGTTGPDSLWLDPASGTLTTPFVVLPGLLTGECVHSNGFGWLRLTLHDGSGRRAHDIPGDMTPAWGTHIVDMNVVMGNLRHLAATQGAAWLGAHPMSGAAHR